MTNAFNALNDGGKKSICGWCKGRCDVQVHCQGERLSKVEIIRNSSDGALGRGCKGLRYKNAIEWFYHPDRLTHPLKRAAERGVPPQSELDFQAA
jgi:anaerobic selenocysteine-containing dehydrogenase